MVRQALAVLAQLAVLLELRRVPRLTARCVLGFGNPPTFAIHRRRAPVSADLAGPLASPPRVHGAFRDVALGLCYGSSCGPELDSVWRHSAGYQ